MPVPPFAATGGEAHSQASPEAGYDDDWRYYPEYDPIFQLIPQGLRPLTETEEAIRAGCHYDSEKSDHSVDPPIDLRDEYPEHFEEVEQEEYRRYRIRGGAKRFRPSDIGDEEIYRTLDLPPINETTDGWYHNDHAHLSPTVDRLASWDYRKSIRKWFNHLDPPPTTLVELKQLWLLNWSSSRGPVVDTKTLHGSTAQDSAHMDAPPAQPNPTAKQQQISFPVDPHAAYPVTHPHLNDRSTQTPRAPVVDKGTQARQPPGKPKWTQYYEAHCQQPSLLPRPASPVDNKCTCACNTGSKHCQCQRS